MPIAVREFSDLDAEAVTLALEEASARVAESNPRLDTRRGAIHDILLYYHSLMAAQGAANIEDYNNARSMLEITADPTLADADLVDGVLSNFGIVRKEGGTAEGEVAIVVSSNATLTLSLGFQFSANGRTFSTGVVYTAKAEAEQINNENDRLLTQTTDGNWIFTVFVTADEEGTDSNLAKDTLLTPLVLPANYVTSYAASSFTGGRITETNEELITRQQEGIACKAPSNRVNMMAMLRQIEDFSRVVAASIVGMGHPEMLRDSHWIFPVGGGGRVDWYIRSEERVTRLRLQKTATCLSKDASTDSSLWQISITRDDAPGFFEFRDVRRLDDEESLGGYDIESEVRSIDLSGDGFRPDVVTVAEVDYSRFCAAVIQFRDNGSGQDAFTVGGTATYQLEASCLPLIAEIQDTFSETDIRSRSADLLVKAPVPCFVSVAFTVFKRAGQDDPDLEAIQNDIAEAVNQTPFTGKLFASTLQAVISNHLLEGQRTGRLDLLGRIRYPGGEIAYIRSEEVLTVPDLPEDMVSARTVQFFLDPTNVGISVETSLVLSQ